jgi:antitoxin YefM
LDRAIRLAARSVDLYSIPVQEDGMPVEASYTEARENLAELLDRVERDREVVLISRRGRAKVALLAADELEGLLETAHLLRSPRNAARLQSALRRALGRKGRPQPVGALRRRLGLDRA